MLYCNDAYLHMVKFERSRMSLNLSNRRREQVYSRVALTELCESEQNHPSSGADLQHTRSPTMLETVLFEESRDSCIDPFRHLFDR